MKFIYPNLKLYLSPIVTDYNYLDFILDLIEKNKIDIYIPLIDEELILAKSIDEINPDLKVLIPSKSFIELCLNKFRLMNKLNELNISKTKSYLSSSFNWEINPPIFLNQIWVEVAEELRKSTVNFNIKFIMRKIKMRVIF